VLGTLGWIAFLAALVVLEIIDRSTHRVVGPSRLAQLLARRAPGRWALAVIWAFVGLHLFARYTIVR
jgi:hypothetical protein